jgi:hypothetical protein
MKPGYYSEMTEGAPPPRVNLPQMCRRMTINMRLRLNSTTNHGPTLNADESSVDRRKKLAPNAPPPLPPRVGEDTGRATLLLIINTTAACMKVTEHRSLKNKGSKKDPTRGRKLIVIR